MKAPKYAYIRDAEGDFFKAVIAHDGQLYPSFVARYFQGAEADGGYSPTAELMKYNVLRIFHLDDIKDIGVRDPDNGTCRVIGFIGMVDINGPSAKYHNLDKRGSGCKIVRGTKTLMILNDAGLNTRPLVEISITSRYANYITGSIRVAAGFYVPCTGGSAQKGIYELNKVDIPRIKIRQSWSTIINESYATPVNSVTGRVEQYSGPIDQGTSVSLSVSADSDEGNNSSSFNFVTLRRILYPRPTCNFCSYEPSSLQDLEHEAVDIDMFESDAIDMYNVQQGDSASPVVTPPIFANIGSPNLITSNLVKSGWYRCQLFDRGGSDTVTAYYVECGYVQYCKNVPKVGGRWGVKLSVSFQEHGSSGWPDSPGGSWRYRIAVSASYYAESGNPTSDPPSFSISDFSLRTAESKGGNNDRLLDFSSSVISDTLSISASKRSDTSAYIYAKNSMYDGSTDLWMAVSGYSIDSNPQNLTVYCEEARVKVKETDGGGSGPDTGVSVPDDKEPGGTDTGA